MPSAEDNVQLLWLIVSQKLDDGQLTGMDWSIVAAALGLEKDAAAQLRWRRLKKELTENGGIMSEKPAKKGASKGKGKKKDADDTPTKKQTPKKRKVQQVKDEEDEMDDMDESLENDGQGDQSLEVDEDAKV